MSYCNVLYYPDSNAKLLALLSERHNFDSVLFIFDGSRRYKFQKADLGIRSASDLLMGNRGLLSLLNPTWSYYLYLLDERHTYSIDSLCGKVLCCYVHLPLPDECHVFVDRGKHHLAQLSPYDFILLAVQSFTVFLFKFGYYKFLFF
jgi:hypothetical protein